MNTWLGLMALSLVLVGCGPNTKKKNLGSASDSESSTAGTSASDIFDMDLMGAGVEFVEDTSSGSITVDNVVDWDGGGADAGSSDSDQNFTVLPSCDPVENAAGPSNIQVNPFNFNSELGTYKFWYLYGQAWFEGDNMVSYRGVDYSGHFDFASLVILRQSQVDIWAFSKFDLANWHTGQLWHQANSNWIFDSAGFTTQVAVDCPDGNTQCENELNTKRDLLRQLERDLQAGNVSFTFFTGQRGFRRLNLVRRFSDGNGGEFRRVYYAGEREHNFLPLCGS